MVSRLAALACIVLLATPVLARPRPAQLGVADLTLSISADPIYNGGEQGTVTATVTNLGPRPAALAGVRLFKLSNRQGIDNPLETDRFLECVDLPDSVLCTTPTLAAGESHTFRVPFTPPDGAGPIILGARTSSATPDPNPGNDTANATASVVSMADLVTLVHPPFGGANAGVSSEVQVRVTNVAALKATGVTAFVSIPPSAIVNLVDPACMQAGTDQTYVCSVKDLTESEATLFFLVTPPVGSSESFPVTARAESAQPEFTPADNTRTEVFLTLAPVPALVTKLSNADQLDSNNQVTLNLTIANPTDLRATGLTAFINFSFPVPLILSADAPGWTCGPGLQTFIEVCTRDSLEAHTPSTIALRVQYPTKVVRSPLSVSIAQRGTSQLQGIGTDALFFRSFDVTTTADSGPGSLRQAILDANAQCRVGDVPCRIAFRIPASVPSSGWFTIQPLSPLPPVTGIDLYIDGETQTALTGDTNPLGPEIFLIGDRAGDANGLELASGFETVRGMAIGGFARNGIETFSHAKVSVIRSDDLVIERNYIGLDPTGARAVPNGQRGVVGTGFRGGIRHNVMSGNIRSGIALDGADTTDVTSNRIGVAAATDDPLPNGASGVFVSNTDPVLQVFLQGNMIEFNHDFGVAVAQASRVEIFDNVIARNGGAAIDLGMDGPSAGSIDGPFAPPPVITSARYNTTTGVTVIEGTGPPNTSSTTPGRNVYGANALVYVNDRPVSEGQRFLGQTFVDSKGHFILGVKGDLRGLFIDGTTELVRSPVIRGFATTLDDDPVLRMTSEFGPTLPVTGQ